MTGGKEGVSSTSIAIEGMPKTALQAIYHAVTGKTENLSKELNGNVLIRENDIDRLHGMMIDQINLHHNELEPTVTVVIKHDNDKLVTYSSWSRYKALRVSNQDVTSEVTIKYEFLIRLPETPNAQRCTVNINIDSSLPILKSRAEKSEDEAEALGFFLMIKRTWKTVVISIDFVDFLVAKSFSNLAEEWFSSLEKMPKSTFHTFLFSRLNLVQSSISQVGRLGMGIFLLALAVFKKDDASLSGAYLTFAAGLGFSIWAVLNVIGSSVSKSLFKRLQSNLRPTIILLSEGDQKAYDIVRKSRKSSAFTVAQYLLSIVLAITLNILASYIYTYLSSD